MPLNLNKIDISGWKENPNVAVAISKEIEQVSWEESKFEPFLGRGYDRGIRSYEVSNTSPCRPRLRPKLEGEGVVGNADFDTNTDNFEILTQTMYPIVVGNSIKSEVEHYQKMNQINFTKESAEGLKTWYREKKDKNFATALYNDITNVVVCDATDGFKDTTAKTSVQEATREITQGDVLNVKAIKRAIFMAQTGTKYNGKDAFPIRPLRVTKQNAQGFSVSLNQYAILVDSYGATQLRNDPEWKEMQKMDKRGQDINNLFTGFLGVIDGCPVIDVGIWSRSSVGLVNSEVSEQEYKNNINPQNFTTITPPAFYANNQPQCMAFLIGASALIIAGSTRPTFYIDDTADLGRKTICGIDGVLSIAKGRFGSENGELSIYHDSDYAVIGIAHSKEA